MGLFRKRKKQNTSQLPNLPKFGEEDLGKQPTFPSMAPERDPKALTIHPPQEKVELPAYESPFQEKRPTLAVPNKPIDLTQETRAAMPQRDPAFIQPKPVYKERVDTSHLDTLIPGTPQRAPVKQVQQEPEGELFLEEPVLREKEPRGTQVFKQMTAGVDMKHVQERPVFVQLDNYRDAIKAVEVLKQKIREIEYGLDRLNEIKSQEQVEISNCETSLNKIKERLIDIDKKLFEI